MAGPVPSISRRRVLGAAAALPVLAMGGQLRETVPECAATCARRLWDRRLARYRRLAAAAAEAAETGWFREANERYEREAAETAAPFGGESDQARRLRRAAFERVSAAEDAYWERCTEPMQRAAVALALTPAPDLAAVREKIGVMRAVRLHELGGMPRAYLEVLEEDLGRLG